MRMVSSFRINNSMKETILSKYDKDYSKKDMWEIILEDGIYLVEQNPSLIQTVVGSSTTSTPIVTTIDTGISQDLSSSMANADGQYFKSDKKEMVLGKTFEVEHHAKELRDSVLKNKNVDAWVVAKVQRASTDLSDVAHYIDNRNNVKNKIVRNLSAEGNEQFVQNNVYGCNY